MATVEELLVRLGVDPVSVTQFIDDVNDAKNRAEDEAGTLELTLRSNAGQQIAGVTASVKTLGQQTQSFTTQFRQGLNQVGEAADELKASLLGIGAIAAFGLGAAIGKAAEESRNLAAANVILQFSTAELAAAQQDLRGVADEVGITFQEVSAALFDVASAGFEGAQALEVTTAAARVARPANTDVATAFNAIATAMTNFGFAADEASDKLVRTADITRGSLADVSEALGILGPIAGQFGISFDEIAASFALLTNRGIPAARAATALNAAISAFISPAGEATKVLEDLGIATGDDAFATQDLADKFDILSQASKEGRVELGKLFSIEALRGAAALTGGVEELRENIEAVGNATGRTEEALTSFFQQTGPQLDKLGASFINLVTIVGEDFLESLDGTIRTISAFITDNRELIAVLVELGLAFAAVLLIITGVSFAVRQLASFQKLFSGASLAAQAAISLVTTALKADTTATLANTAARRAGILSEALVFLRSIRAALLVEISTLTPNIALWIKRAAVVSAQTFVATLAAIARFLIAIPAETLALIANTRAWLANAASQFTFRGAAIGTVRGLGNVGRALGSVQGAVGVLAAAFIGFQVGSFLNDILGISDAVGDLTREVLRAEQALREEFLSPIERETLEGDAQALADFNRILRENTELTRQAAFIQALSTQARIAFLRRLQEENRISSAQTAELALREVELADAIAESNKEVDRLTELTKDAGKAREILGNIEKQFQKILKDTERELIAVRRGQEAAQIVAARQAFDKRLEILRQQAAAEVALTRETEAKIVAARAEGVGEDALGGLQRTLETQQANVERTLQAISDQFEIFTARIVDTGAKRIESVRSQADQEISIARKLADGVIKEERRKATEAAREIDRLRDARDRGIRDAEAFLEELTQAAIRRVDPALAELRRLEQTAIRRLSGASAATAERAIALLRDRIEQLAGATQQEIRAQRELDALNKRIAAADPDRDVSGDIERRLDLQQQLVKLQELREQRAAAAIETERRITEAALEAGDRQEEVQGRIEAQQQRILEVNENVAKVKDELLLKEQEIGRELDKNIAKEQQFVRANLEALRIAVAFSRAITNLGADPAAAQGLKEELEAATQRVRELEQVTIESRRVAAQAVGVLKDKGDDALTALANDLIEQQAAQKAVAEAAASIVPLSDELTRVTEVTAVAQEQFATSIDEVLAQQITAGQSSTNFANTVNVKLGEIGDEFQNQGSRLSRLEREAAQKRIAAEEEVAAGGL